MVKFLTAPHYPVELSKSQEASNKLRGGVLVWVLLSVLVIVPGWVFVWGGMPLPDMAEGEAGAESETDELVLWFDEALMTGMLLSEMLMRFIALVS